MYADGSGQPPTGYNFVELVATYAYYIDLYEYWAYYSLDATGGSSGDFSKSEDSWNLIYGTDYEAFAVWLFENFPDGELVVWRDDDRYVNTGFDPNHYEPPDGNGLYDNWETDYHIAPKEGSHGYNEYQFIRDYAKYRSPVASGYQALKIVDKAGLLPQPAKKIFHAVKSVKRFFKKPKKRHRWW